MIESGVPALVDLVPVKSVPRVSQMLVAPVAGQRLAECCSSRELVAWAVARPTPVVKAGSRRHAAGLVKGYRGCLRIGPPPLPGSPRPGASTLRSDPWVCPGEPESIVLDTRGVFSAQCGSAASSVNVSVAVVRWWLRIRMVRSVRLVTVAQCVVRGSAPAAVRWTPVGMGDPASTWVNQSTSGSRTGMRLSRTLPRARLSSRFGRPAKEARLDARQRKRQCQVAAGGVAGGTSRGTVGYGRRNRGRVGRCDRPMRRRCAVRPPTRASVGRGRDDHRTLGAVDDRRGHRDRGDARGQHRDGHARAIVIGEDRQCGVADQLAHGENRHQNNVVWRATGRHRRRRPRRHTRQQAERSSARSEAGRHRVCGDGDRSGRRPTAPQCIRATE